MVFRRPRRFVLCSLLLSTALGATTYVGASTPDVIGGERASEPVVLSGTTIGTLIGTPTSEVYVYAYNGGTWRPIPYQIDEINESGAPVASEDNILDANDQVVFMAQDLGAAAGNNWPDQSGQVDGVSWQQIEVTDPQNSASNGYAYVVRQSGTPTRSPTSYVSFDAGNRRIVGQTYQLGYSLSSPSTGRPEQPNIWFDYLSIGNGSDILDRSPKFEGCTGGSCLKEAFLFANTPAENGLSVIKQGPIRILLRAQGGSLVTTLVAAYGSSTSWSLTLTSPTLALSSVRVSTDFTENVSGATFYNAATNGVTVDGNPDAVPATPFSPWWQVSTPSGSVVQAADVSDMGGTPQNYYVDNGTACGTLGCDTGDLRKFGDSGVQILNPEQNFTYRLNQYYVAGQRDNVGARYQNYFTQPLTVRVQTTLRPAAYLPLVVR